MVACPDPEDRDELVLRAIEGALAGVRFGPNANIEHGTIKCPTRDDQLADMPPITTNVMNGAID